MKDYRKEQREVGKRTAKDLQAWLHGRYKGRKDEQGNLINVKASTISLGSVYNLLKRDAERMELREQQRKGGKGKRGSRD